MRKEFVFVSGFTRCGSSLVMQMLSAGGMPVFYDFDMGYPAFETHFNTAGEIHGDMIGHATKWLEPLRSMPPCAAADARTIWLTRNHREQAKSTIKFATALGLERSLAPSTARLSKSYDRDEIKSRDEWGRIGPVLVVEFEMLVSDPKPEALRIAEFVGRDLDIGAMVDQVIPRSSRCLSYLLEAELIKSALGKEEETK